MNRWRWMNCAAWLSLAVMIAAIVGCEVKDATSTGGKSSATNAGGSDGLSGTIEIDGSSTVFLISRAAAEEFPKQHPKVRIKVGERGTGGGFERFAAGEIDINDASRPISQKEIDKCKQSGIEYLELKIAIDGLTVVVHPENDWVPCLSVEQLKKLWENGSQLRKWNELDPSWPDAEIKLFGADTDSGTFDYFTEAICGKEGNSRSDYTPSTDDNVLVRGVSGEKNGLGYFGYAYYFQNKDRVKAVAISPTGQSGDCVSPSPETIETGTYKPLSRPLFVYVSTKALARPEVQAFLKYYLNEGQALVESEGYVRLPADQQKAMVEALDTAIAGLADGAPKTE